MPVSEKVLEELRKEPDVQLDLSWLNPPTEQGMSARPGRHGLTLEDVEQGSYGQVPTETGNWNMRLRGAAPLPNARRIGVRWNEKAQSWAESVMLLYEEAQARQWSSATDIPWDELTELDDDVELAMCQLCTFLNQVEFIAGDVPGRWLKNISNDHYETKLFLASQIMDEGRHLDVFRKRALANGAGLLQGSGGAIGILYDADMVEMTTTLHIGGEGAVQSVFRMGELIANNEAEKRIFRLAAQDESRHVAFGVMHVKHLLETQPERHDEIRGYLEGRNASQGNGGIAIGGTNSEALAILFAKGRQNIDEGYMMLLAARQKQFRELTQRLRVCGLADLADDMEKRRAAFLAGDPLDI
jgi:hypothetical protein